MKKLAIALTGQALRKHVGHISQLAGTKHYRMCQGLADGLEAVDVKTGSGLYYTVLPGRGMDIAHAEYKGISLAYIAKPGLVGSQYYQHGGMEWLRSFSCGLLTTCGLSNVGPNTQEGLFELGLHGRIANLPAQEVLATTQWKGKGPEMRVQGRVRESAIFSENLVLSRTITSKFRESRLLIRDEITNDGEKEAPLMLLYHINLGYPIVSEHSRMYIKTQKIQPRDDYPPEQVATYFQCQPPQAGYEEQVYFHGVMGDDQGNTAVAMVNEALNLGVYLQYNVRELPCFSQWKMLGEQDYVMGLEPGNAIPEGQTAAKERGTLVYLRPEETKQITLEIGVLDGVGVIRRFVQKWID